MKAVIPAGGWGTRLLPATKSQPKEMLPVVNKPAIQYVVEEAASAGIEDITIITGRWKRAIEDHFDRSYELEMFLKKKGMDSVLEEVRSISHIAHIHYVRQHYQRGLGDAVYQARYHIRNEYFAVLLGDDIIISDKPAIGQLMEVHSETGKSVVGVEEVPKEMVDRYGIVEIADDGTVTRVVEKPCMEEAPSTYAVIGRYVLSPDVFDYLQQRGTSGEMDLTGALNHLASEGRLVAHFVEGRRYDIGTTRDWLRANIELGKQYGIL